MFFEEIEKLGEREKRDVLKPDPIGPIPAVTALIAKAAYSKGSTFIRVRDEWGVLFQQEPCVFSYLADGPDDRPRIGGNPPVSRCIHQMRCIACEAFIAHEQAEAIEKDEGEIVISVPIPLPPQMVAELKE